jgi:hypothetical protein
MQKLAILTISLLAPCAAWACPEPPYPSTDACLRWTYAPEDYPGETITFNVYRDGVKVASTPAYFFKFTRERSGERCYYVTAVVGGVESPPSGTGCKTIRPAAPTDGSIEAPTDGSFEPPIF